MMVKITNREKELFNEIMPWMTVTSEGYPCVKKDAPEHIKEKYKEYCEIDNSLFKD